MCFTVLILFHCLRNRGNEVVECEFWVSEKERASLKIRIYFWGTGWGHLGDGCRQEREGHIRQNSAGLQNVDVEPSRRIWKMT